VIGGLALGWAWFAICGIAFGGRILHFGAAAEVAAKIAEPGGLAGTDAGGNARAPLASTRSRRGS
jgi:hypothetical protein